jgi:hypothetical protein
MSLYDVDYSKVAQDILPTHKRTDIVEVTDSLQEPLNDLNVFFKWFREGSSAGQWNNAVSYTFGQVVKYSRKVYVRNEITDGYASGIIPTDSTYWDNVSNNFVGVLERIQYTPQKLSLEYALNKAFGTTFNNPPTLSQIYIQNVNTTDVNLFVGVTDGDTGTIPETDSTALFFIGESDFVAGETDFEIFIPFGVYTALGTTNTERNLVIGTIVEKYKLAGYTYKITTY